MDAGIFLTACAENRVEDVAEMFGAADDALRLQALKIARLSGAEDVAALLETVSEPAANVHDDEDSTGYADPPVDAAKKEQSLKLLGVLRVLASKTRDRDSREPDSDTEHITPEQLIDPDRTAALESLPDIGLAEQPLAEALFLYRQSSLLFDLTGFDKAVDFLTDLAADQWFLHWALAGHEQAEALYALGNIHLLMDADGKPRRAVSDRWAEFHAALADSPSLASRFQMDAQATRLSVEARSR